MHEQLLHFEVVSPLDLTDGLRLVPAAQGGVTRFAELRLYGADILVRQFELPRSSLSALGNVLRLECAEVLSTEPDEIELDYCVLQTQAENIKGLYIAISRRILREYLSSFDGSDIIPAKMTGQIISRATDYLRAHKIQSSSFCLLDFFKTNLVNLTVFIDGRCELLRVINYDTENEAEQKINDSIRYIFGRSSSKKLYQVYISGDVSGREGFISRLREKIGVDTEADDSAERGLNAFYMNAFLKLNLLKKHYVGLTLRNRILQAEKFTLAICIVIGLFLGAQILKKGILINKLKSSFSQTDYKRALSLAEKIRALRR